MFNETYMGVSRKKIPWAPKIDYNQCNLCDSDPQCLKFCPHDVFTIEEEPRKLIVNKPNHCVVFCRSCRRVCAPNALSFPNKAEILKIIKQERGF
jgi:NAD-dependent dihydropyrimidine dehydrogenase PreA subunit